MGVEYTHSYGPSGPRHRSSLTHVFITFRNRLCLGAFLLGKMMFPFSHKLMPRYILNTIAMNAMRIWTIWIHHRVFVCKLLSYAARNLQSAWCWRSPLLSSWACEHPVHHLTRPTFLGPYPYPWWTFPIGPCYYRSCWSPMWKSDVASKQIFPSAKIQDLSNQEHLSVIHWLVPIHNTIIKLLLVPN